MVGFILYEGPSMLDGEPIVCIATKPHVDPRKVYKTQGIVATYILCCDTDPLEALRSREDVSICGDCIHRGPNRSCYVPVWGGVRNIWLAYGRGKYARGGRLQGEVVRLGAYGDPAAVPELMWASFLAGNTPIGYAHQWRRLEFSFLKQWCMASCESELDRREAKALGWRTFRVRAYETSPTLAREVLCPTSQEVGYKTSCGECRACGGLSAKAACDIVITAHGSNAIWARAKIERLDRASP